MVFRGAHSKLGRLTVGYGNLNGYLAANVIFVTPEATRDLLDRELLGIAEALRASALSAGIVDAGVSRGLAGISGSTLVVNLAGSRPAVRDGMATLNPLAVQIIGQLSSLEI